jgi:hypothetical protein
VLCHVPVNVFRLLKGTRLLINVLILVLFNDALSMCMGREDDHER